MMAWLRLHGYAFADALRRLRMQPVATLFSIALLALALAFPLLASVALRALDAVAGRVDADPRVNVFMALDASDDDARRVQQALASDPRSAAVRFVPRAQALREMQASTELAELLASLERNPLPDAFTVRVKASTPDAVSRTAADFAKLPKVERAKADAEWATRLAAWIRFARTLLLASAILLAGAILFGIGHLVRLQVLTRREEIEVSRLIGATASDTRRPFLYAGALQGAAAGVIGAALAAAAGLWLQTQMQALAPAYGIELEALSLASWEWMAAVLGAATLGWIGARVAVSRELAGLARR